jgi:hypothetical protein
VYSIDKHLDICGVQALAVVANVLQLTRPDARYA